MIFRHDQNTSRAYTFPIAIAARTALVCMYMYNTYAD